MLQSYEDQLFNNPYPGRTIIVGMSPSGKHFVQVYWIMGRSVNSRNRIFERNEQFVRNRAYDAAKMEDPSLIIYDPIKSINGMHIISNGDQTETIYEAYGKKESSINADHKISLLVKFIHTDDRKVEFKIINKNQTF